MGVVYRAEDEKLRRTVALKLLPDTSRNEERRQRFLREARSAAAITHPNVAVVYAVDEADGRVYIAMELVEGENLRARLERGRLGVATARELAGQIARGLAAAHDKGIVHRDLKPENVMITPAGVVKILDFGLAKPGVVVASGKTEAALARTETVVTSDEGRIMGTPEYMSPEQAMGEAVDVRSDVFSLGIVLYEMLSGARPFTGASTRAVLVAIARDTPPPLRQKVPEVDDATEAVVTRCLAKAAGERFAHGGEIVAALAGQTSAKATTESRTDVAPLTRSGRTGRRSRGSRVGRAILVVAGVALVLGGLGVLWRESSRLRAAAVTLAAVAGDADSRRGRAITDHPPPVTRNPEAAAAYAKAIQNLRDGSLTMANVGLERAAQLDPDFAAARLRVIWWKIWSPSYVSIAGVRDHYAAALQNRTSLDERDQLLLRAAEVLTRDPLDSNELASRFREVLNRFPRDAEALLFLGASLSLAGNVDDARTVLEEALDVDPQFAAVLWTQSALYLRNPELLTDDRLDAAQAILARCVGISPSAASCLRNRSIVHEMRGQCREFEADARQMTVVEPTGERAYEFLAAALAQNGAPIESVKAALDHRLALHLAAFALKTSDMADENDLRLAAVTGDLTTFSSAALALDRSAEADTSEAAHAIPIMALTRALDEEGQSAEALRVAEAAARRAGAWTANAPGAMRLYLLYARHRMGRVSDADFAEHRDTLLHEAASRSTPDGLPLETMRFYARYVARPDEARDALPHMVDVSTVVDPAQRGRVYLLTGRTDDAESRYSEPGPRLATACRRPEERPSSKTRSSTFTPTSGSARHCRTRATKPGACAAYAVVLDRWKNAKPRSVTLEEARARSKALECAP